MKQSEISNLHKKRNSSLDENKEEVGFWKFLFAIKLPLANFYFFLGTIMMLMFSLITTLLEIFYGFCLNLIQIGDMVQLPYYCLALGLMGLLLLLFYIFVGYLFRQHSYYICEKYKLNYYSLIFKQDFSWFNKQDLNKLSESIKSDIEKIQFGTGRKLFLLVKYIANLLFMVILFFVLNWKITLTIIPFFILILLTSGYYEKQVAIMTKNNNNFNYHQAGYIRELTSKYKTLLSFGNFNYEKSFYKNLIKQNYISNTNISLHKYIITNSINFFVYSINAIVIIFGAYIIKENIENNTYQNNATDLASIVFNFRSGQILSIIILVFYLKFYFSEIFVSLKELSETCKGVQNYFHLAKLEENKIKNSIDIDNRRIQISEGNNTCGGSKSFKIEEINFVEVSFYYEKEDKCKVNDDANQMNGDNNKRNVVNDIEEKKNKKEEDKNNNNELRKGIDSTMRKYSENLNLKKLNLILSPKRKKKTFYNNNNEEILDLKNTQVQPLNLNDEKSNANSKENKETIPNSRKTTTEAFINFEHKGSCAEQADHNNRLNKGTTTKDKPSNTEENKNQKINKAGKEINAKVSQSIYNSPKKRRLEAHRQQNKNENFILNPEGVDNNSDNNKDEENGTEVDYMVTFNEKFNNKKLQLNNLNFRFEINKINYLIGKSGSGKTTILSLILNLFKPTSGKILINNHLDIDRLEQDEYSSFIGYVPQESIFYDLSIKENIRFFQENVEDEKIITVANFLKIDKFISKMKNGIDTKIGPNGSEISGGQRQLISMARALVRNPKILLLDEFTSNFDNILAKEIFRILNEISKDIIVIVVTHNLKIVDFTNKKNNIIFINEGKITEKHFDNNSPDMLNRFNNDLKNYLINQSFKLNKNPDECSVKSNEDFKNCEGENKIKDYNDESCIINNDNINHIIKHPTSKKVSSEAVAYEKIEESKGNNAEINNNPHYNKGKDDENDIEDCLNSSERFKKDEVEPTTLNVITRHNKLNENKKKQEENENKNSNQFNLNNQFFKKFINKHKKSLIYISLSFFFSSIILVSYGIIFYFLSTRMYSTDIDEVIFYGKIFFGIFLSYGICDCFIQIFQKIEIDKVSNALIFSLRKKMFAWFLNLNIPALNDNNKNEIIKIFTDDIIIVGSTIRTCLGLTIEVFFTFLSSFIISLIFDWRFGLIIIFFIFVLMVFMMYYYNWNSKLKIDVISVDYFSETIANIKLIKAFNLKQNLLDFLITNEKNIKNKPWAYNHLGHFISFGILPLTVYVELGLLNYIAGIFIIDNNISNVNSYAGSSCLFFIYLIVTTLIWKYLSDIYYIFQSFGKLNEFINKKYKNLHNEVINVFSDNNTDKKKFDNKNCVNAVEFQKASCENDSLNRRRIINGKIEFRNVSFSYSSEKNKNKIIDNLSFIIYPGSKVGFVGSSGCGKSTIIQLLLRFYEPNEGEIFLDEINIKDFEVNELRDYFSGVFQEPDLFERSIYENIKYGNLNATDEQIVAVALITQIPLMLLDKSNNQNIMQISGGQKQKIALARCLLKERKVYFFDEATSALDINTEMKINYNLDNYFTNLEEEKTLIIIAHRLINIQNADEIFVMKDGKIVEQGNHENLLLKNGLFNELWQKEKLQK